MAAVAELCVQYEADYRPNMSIVAEALPFLLRVQESLEAAILEKMHPKSK
jgi:hypothetical protein